MTSLTKLPSPKARTFLDWAPVPDLAALSADVALLGIPFNAPYAIEEVANDQSRGPDWVRAYSNFAQWGDDRYDFDFGGLLLDGRNVALADCGDVLGSTDDSAGNVRNAVAAVQAILEAGALPFILGGDHGTTVPALRAYEGRGPISLVQVDAHLDWRDHVNGVRDGYSSPIRRASELPWVQSITQIGLRGVGSARVEEVEAAKAWGSRLITAWEVHDMSRDELLACLPKEKDVYLTIDADGLDPSVMPATNSPSPGGLTLAQTRAIIRHVVENNRLVGMDVVEVAPKRDVGGISAIVAGRLILNAIGFAARAGYFERSTRRDGGQRQVAATR